MEKVLLTLAFGLLFALKRDVSGSLSPFLSKNRYIHFFPNEDIIGILTISAEIYLAIY